MKIGMINNISFKMNHKSQQERNAEEMKKRGSIKGRFQLELMKHPLPDPEKMYDADYKPGLSRFNYDYTGLFESMDGERVIVLKEETQNEKDDSDE